MVAIYSLSELFTTFPPSFASGTSFASGAILLRLSRIFFCIAASYDQEPVSVLMLSNPVWLGMLPQTGSAQMVSLRVFGWELCPPILSMEMLR